MLFFNESYLLYITPIIVYGVLTVINTDIFQGRLFILPYQYANYINPLHMATSTLLQQKTTYVTDVYTVTTRKAIKDLQSQLHLLHSSIVHPFIKYKANYRLAPRYSLSVCTIEKAMSTILQNIFCYLYDPVGFIANNRTIPTDFWGTHFCYNKNEIWSTPEKHILAPLMPTSIFMVRNPIDRFLSGFVDNGNTTCYGCSDDVLCAVENFYAEIVQMDKDNWNDTINKLSPIKASDLFIDTSFETAHFVPLNWRCDLLEETDNLIFIKYGETAAYLDKTYADLKSLFEAHGVEKDKIDYIFSSIRERTKHATKSSGKQDKYLEVLKASPHHVRLLNEIYFHDYQIFGYEPL